jgi:hypothetical protein
VLSAADQNFSYKAFILLPLLLPLGTKIRENFKSRKLKSGYYCVYICKGLNFSVSQKAQKQNIMYGKYTIHTKTEQSED